LGTPFHGDQASVGEERIAERVNLGSRWIREQDKPDLFQEVNSELLEEKELGFNYREKIGSASLAGDFSKSDEFLILARCVDRVVKRFQRTKQHQSIDQLREGWDFEPTDPRTMRGASLIEQTTLLKLYRYESDDQSQKLLDLMPDNFTAEEICERLDMGRTTYFALKKKLVSEITELLLGGS